MVHAVINAADATCLLTLDGSPPIEVYCGGALTYNIHRSLTSGLEPGPTNRIASLVAATSWDDFDVVYGERYYSVVRAVDLGNGAWNSVGSVMSTVVRGLDESTAHSWQARAVNGNASTEADGGVWWTFITTPYLFGDDFESGDVSAWSAVTP